MPTFPATPEELTPALLTELLAEFHPGVRVDDLRILSVAQCGDGQASTADRVVLELEYATEARGGTGATDDLPRQVMLKTMLASPHAPPVMYENEVRFYRELRPQLHMEAPRVLTAGFDSDTGQFGVLMEDLNLRGARFPFATTPISIEEMRGLLANQASLHAMFWESPRLATDLAWVPTPLAGGMFSVFDQYGLALISDQVEKHGFKSEIIAPLGQSLEYLWARLWQLQHLQTQAPTTLLHGDSHIANTYLLPDGTGGLLDWQLLVQGRWAHDVAYLMVTGLTVEQRRTHERELLRFYREALRAAGVKEVPTADEGWLGYRQSVLWGLVIGWLITPPENYGEPITRANLERLVAAMIDLDTLSSF